VVNHHLLLADLAVKREGFGEILPGAAAFVLDEAHQLPELAAQFFGEASARGSCSTWRATRCRKPRSARARSRPCSSRCACSSRRCASCAWR
jgi:ATP-dependent DNA helicase DinG